MTSRQLVPTYRVKCSKPSLHFLAATLSYVINAVNSADLANSLKKHVEQKHVDVHHHVCKVNIIKEAIPIIGYLNPSKDLKVLKTEKVRLRHR